MNFEIVPIPDQNYEGRQWGWRIMKDGEPYLDCAAGGSGDCWNIRAPEDEEGDFLHFCDLDEAIRALTTLRESEAHRRNVARWE